MPDPSLTVFIIDDDASIRDSLALMLGLAGYSTRLFADAESFLAAHQEGWAGCVLADLRLPGLSGVELQERMRARGRPLPFIIITAHGDVSAARAAFLADAVDFLEKPFDQEQLARSIGSAFAREERRIEGEESRRIGAQKLSRLTPREKQVLEQAARGRHAKEIGQALGISARTVEVHKTRIMEKTGARNTAELVRLAIASEESSASRKRG